MRTKSPFTLKNILSALAGTVLCASAAAASEQVDIPNGAVTVHATLYRPEGAGPFPAVVALHDCGGLVQRPNTQAQLYSEWVKVLVADGFVVLFPDSFASRGLGSQCREHDIKAHASRERAMESHCSFGQLLFFFPRRRRPPDLAAQPLRAGRSGPGARGQASVHA